MVSNGDKEDKVHATNQDDGVVPEDSQGSGNSGAGRLATFTFSDQPQFWHVNFSMSAMSWKPI